MHPHLPIYLNLKQEKKKKEKKVASQTPSTVRPWARGFCPHGRPGPLGFGLCGRLPRHGVGGFMFNSSSSSSPYLVKTQRKAPARLSEAGIPLFSCRFARLRFCFFCVRHRVCFHGRKKNWGPFLATPPEVKFELGRVRRSIRQLGAPCSARHSHGVTGALLPGFRFCGSNSGCQTQLFWRFAAKRDSQPPREVRRISRRP